MRQIIMKTQKQRFSPGFGPKDRFGAAVLDRIRLREVPELDRMKRQLLRSLLDQISDPELTSLLRAAANEATALASTTDYPLLVLPVLFEEKAEDARRYQARQLQIRERSAQLLGISE